MKTKKLKALPDSALDALQRKDGFITVDEAARRALVSKATIYAWARADRVSKQVVGLRTVYVSEADIVRLCPHAEAAA
jgi:hypothetical protein